MASANTISVTAAPPKRASRPTVILVPGITSPAITWGFVGEVFGEQFDTYVLDVRGRGLSSAEDGLDYSLDAQAADVLAFAQALKLDRWMIVGHSMGGRIAVRAGRTARGPGTHGADRSARVGSGPPRVSRQAALVHRLDPPGRAGHRRRRHAGLLPDMDRRATRAARRMAAHLQRKRDPDQLRSLRHR
ncbi:alpha/beta fold hydrolase [Cupriavidus basilensis]